MKTTLKQKILMAALNRYFLLLYNVILTVIIISVIIHLIQMMITPENDIREMLKTCNNVAIIFYGYGVAMESRGPLMKFFKLYPEFASPLQSGVDFLCHKFGIYILLLGLAEEILAHLITIPNRIFDTEGREGYIFWICFIILLIVILLLIIFTFNVLRTAHVQSIGGEQAVTPEEQRL
jgi:hypothetical protein